jgi:hypothetical protein
VAVLIRNFVVLRWRLLRGSLRGKGSEKVGVVVSTVASGLLGVGVGLAMATQGRSVADDENLFVMFCVAVAVAVVGISVVAGVTQPVDPRVIAAEPLSDRDRAIGLLASAASGPPGLSGCLIGLGLAVGATRGATSLVIVVPAVLAWLTTLLLLTRTTTNALGLLSNRFPRTGQVVVGLSGLVFYGAFQIVPMVLGNLDRRDRDQITRVISFNPIGQLGRALGAVDESAIVAAGHLALGAIWLPILAAAFQSTTQALTVSTRGGSSPRTATTSPLPAPTMLHRIFRRACGSGGAGAIAWRSVLTRFRTPRTALETFTGAGVGLAAVLVPTLLRDAPGGGAVLVGGAIQLAVLFMSGNSFGADGPALTNELLAGAGPSMLARGKARSIAVVAAPLVVIGPVLAAAITQEWEYLPAGILVGGGGLLAGAGGAIVQSTIVPVAIPDSDNPFASGETGRGMMAALLLGAVLVGLAVVTLPVALALLWANARGSVTLVTVFGAGTVAIGWAVMRGGVAYSARRLTRRGPEFVTAITPSR